MARQGTIVSVPAGDADLKRGELVKLNGSDQVVRTDADTDEPFGVVQETGVEDTADLSAGDPVSVCVEGRCEALIDGSSTSISQGDELMPKDSSDTGRLVSATENAGEYKAAVALSNEMDGDANGELAVVYVDGIFTQTY